MQQGGPGNYGGQGQPPSYYGGPGQPPGNYGGLPPGGAGQIGQVRDPMMWWIMTILTNSFTCGLSTLYWVYLIANEIKIYTGNPDLNPVLDIILAAFTCNYWYFFKYGKEVQKMQQAVGIPANDETMNMWLLSLLCGFGFMKMQEELNKVWFARGARPLGS